MNKTWIKKPHDNQRVWTSLRHNLNIRQRDHPRGPHIGKLKQNLGGEADGLPTSLTFSGTQAEPEEPSNGARVGLNPRSVISGTPRRTTDPQTGNNDIGEATTGGAMIGRTETHEKCHIQMTPKIYHTWAHQVLMEIRKSSWPTVT